MNVLCDSRTQKPFILDLVHMKCMEMSVHERGDILVLSLIWAVPKQVKDEKTYYAWTLQFDIYLLYTGPRLCSIC